MKPVDMTGMTLVHSGNVWPHEQLPCSRQMIRLLEKNEDLVTWVQVPPPGPERAPRLTPARSPGVGPCRTRSP